MRLGPYVRGVVPHGVRANGSAVRCHVRYLISGLELFRVDALRVYFKLY
jgi:hypothetical protein